MAARHLMHALRQVGKRLLFPIPAHVSKNYIEIGSAELASIRDSIGINYHTGWRSPEHYSREGYHQDLHAHLLNRLETARTRIIPWIDCASPLRGKRVLEIGSGTGSSTVALAEQGAQVTGIDVDEGSLLVARDRAKAYWLHADLRAMNTQDISSTHFPAGFDLIIFYACLEHMTLAERLAFAKRLGVIPLGGLLAVVETPNRLRYSDGHTSLLPFFHWLPDELAFAYSRFSPRENFNDLYHEYDAASAEHFFRSGRGISFHEFDVAIGLTRDLRVIGSISSHEGIGYKLRQSRAARKYKSFLRSVTPDVHEGFLDEYLYLILEKDSKRI